MPASSSIHRKVKGACQRCRKQKLKCDVQRPCTLCERANVACLTVEQDNWRSHNVNTRRCSSSTTSEPTEGRRGVKRTRKTLSPEVTKHVAHADNNRSRDSVDNEPVSQPRNSSSALQLIEEAFSECDSIFPAESPTTAFTASQWTRVYSLRNSQPANKASMSPRWVDQVETRSFPNTERAKSSFTRSRAEDELLALLPTQEIASLLIETYFAKIHWFLLIFFQSDFRDRLNTLYTTQSDHNSRHNQRLGHISVVLAVCATSLQYIEPDQKSFLIENGVDPKATQNNILTVLRLRLLDVVALGNLEAVQTCVLLGSFYLYHGEPELAWPICGCGLRISQALDLHRKLQPTQPASSAFEKDGSTKAEEARKRCWWAVYELEMCCSMLYGFPVSINDADYDIEPLEQYLRSSQTCQLDHPRSATLLSYKPAMSRLSSIVKVALTDLYGIRSAVDPRKKTATDDTSGLKQLIARVTRIDAELHAWYSNLPVRLSTPDFDQPCSSLEAIGVSNKKLALSLFQLQAMSLKVAFENARILVHRPLLAYTTKPGHGSQNDASDPFHTSLQICQDAALKISEIGSLPIYKEAIGTYAMPFISLHLFTAGLTLCIITSRDPLGPSSHQTKLGIRKIMEMQSALRSRSVVANQGLEIIEKLTSRVLAKELETMFAFRTTPNASSLNQGSTQDTTVLQNVPNKGHRTEITKEQTESGIAMEPTDFPQDLADSETYENIYPGDAISAANTSEFNFCEDPAMIQALIDMENVLNPTISQFGQAEDVASNEFYQIRGCFENQDPAWIWTPYYQFTQ